MGTIPACRRPRMGAPITRLYLPASQDALSFKNARRHLLLSRKDAGHPRATDARAVDVEGAVHNTAVALAKELASLGDDVGNHEQNANVTAIFDEPAHVFADLLFATHHGTKICRFVLGDKREEAADSRFFGAVKRDEIKGTVITILRRNNL